MVDWALLRTREILTNESLRDRVARMVRRFHRGLAANFDMEYKPGGRAGYSGIRKDFNDDISAWNTSNVTFEKAASIARLARRQCPRRRLVQPP